MRIHEVLKKSAERLRDVTDIPQKEAMILLGNALEKEMSWLIGHGDDDIVVPDVFEAHLARRSLFEPLEYILGNAHFYGKSFDVDARVLIPRPETELLVDKVVTLAKSLPKDAHIVEIGCGSGIISIMLAVLLPHAKLTAIDISHDALNVAMMNAKKHEVFDRITFVHGSYLDSVHEKIDMLVSNPPYIANDEVLGEGLSYEPSLALFGGVKGDEMLCHIIDLFCMRQIKTLVCEMGYDQRQPMLQYAHEKGLEVLFYKDLAGLDRGFWIQEK